jgi:putative transposase
LWRAPAPTAPVGSGATYGRQAFRACGLHKIERLRRAQALRARPRRRAQPKDGGERCFGDRAECARSPVRGGPAQPQMDRRLHLCLDSRGLALCGRGDRSVFAPRCRLVDESRSARLVTDAFLMAIRRRGRPGALLHHSGAANTRASSSSGSWPTTERIGRKVYPTHHAARADVFAYIEKVYNTIRRPSTIGYLSPVEFERKVGLA